MPLIECTTGPVETEVGGETYSFQRDESGRFVCNVPNLRHAECLLSVAAHYRRADMEGPVAEPHDEDEDEDEDEDDGGKTPVHEGDANVFRDLGLAKDGETAEQTAERLDTAEQQKKPAAKKPASKKPASKKAT